MDKRWLDRTIIVVPTYNESGNILNIYEKIFKATGGGHLLIVDDNSPDGTGKIADELAQKDPNVSVLHRTGKMGLGSAYVAGMKHALEKGAQYVIAMDADLSHDPARIPEMLELIQTYDLVIGSRYVKDGGMVNWNARRFLISQLANLYARVMLGLSQADCSGGYKCYRAELLRKIDLDKVFAKGYSFQAEILFRTIRAGGKVIEIPIIFVNRHVGESKLGIDELYGFAWTVFKLWLMRLFGKI